MGSVKVVNFDLSKPRPELAETLYQINLATKATRWGMAEFESLYNKDTLDLNLVQINNQIAGFAVFSVAHPETYLVNLAVLPEVQRQGLGRILMEYSLERQQSKGFSECWLEVRDSNHKAQSFYSSLGFEFVAKRKDFYQQPAEDGQTWVKKFQ